MLNRSGRRLFGLLVFVFVTAVTAAPTVNEGRGFLPSHSDDSTKYNFSSYHADQTNEWYNFDLGCFNADFLKPIVDLQDSATLPSISAKSLPAVPKAIFMVLIGFLCVSLVKDGKFWFAGFTALFWLGQTGLNVLPNLVNHHRDKKHVEYRSSLNIIDLFELNNPLRLYRNDSLYSKKNLSNQPAIIRQQSCLYSFNRLVNINQHLACFSPAFIFVRLARGPPRTHCVMIDNLLAI